MENSKSRDFGLLGILRNFFRYGILGFGRIDQIELQFQTQTKTK